MQNPYHMTEKSKTKKNREDSTGTTTAPNKKNKKKLWRESELK